MVIRIGSEVRRTGLFPLSWNFPPFLPTTDAMDSSIAHPHHPDLRVRNPFANLPACFQLIGIDRIFSAFDVDSHKLAVIFSLELGADILDLLMGKLVLERLNLLE